MKRVLNDSLLYDEGLMWHEGEPFTGIGYFVDADGIVDGEIEYRDGLEWGKTWIAYTPGVPFQERYLFKGTKHGKSREWHPNGQLKEESDFELGFALRRKRWDANGRLLEDYQLKKSDDEYKRLKSFREIYKEDLAREKRADSADHRPPLRD